MTVQNSRGLMFATLFVCAGSQCCTKDAFDGLARRVYCKDCGWHFSGAEHNHSGGASYGRAVLASSSAPIDWKGVPQRDLPRQKTDPKPSRAMCAMIDAIDANSSVHAYASYMSDRGLREVSRRYGYD